MTYPEFFGNTVFSKRFSGGRLQKLKKIMWSLKNYFQFEKCMDAKLWHPLTQLPPPLLYLTFLRVILCQLEQYVPGHHGKIERNHHHFFILMRKGNPENFNFLSKGGANFWNLTPFSLGSIMDFEQVLRVYFFPFHRRI